jgi:hypothetical protein
MKFRLLLLAFCMVHFCNLQLHAQSSKGHVYEDSSLLYPEPEQAPADEEVTQEVTDEDSVVKENDADATDTSLVINKNLLSADSIAHLKNSEPFAYAKTLDSLLYNLKKQQTKNAEPIHDTSPSWVELFFSSTLTKYFFWALAIFFAGFIVVKLFLAGGFFQRSTTRSNVKVLDEDSLTPVKDRNFDALIAKAKNGQNFRLATRYLYLQLLQKLAAANAIQFAADKTNTEYLRELTGKSYKQEVSVLTLNYEYVWYGEFAIDAAAFSRLEARFKNLNV